MRPLCAGAGVTKSVTVAELVILAVFAVAVVIKEPASSLLGGGDGDRLARPSPLSHDISPASSRRSSSKRSSRPVESTASSEVSSLKAQSAEIRSTNSSKQDALLHGRLPSLVSLPLELLTSHRTQMK